MQQGINRLNLDKLQPNGEKNDDEQELILDEYLSAKRLMEATGESELNNVEYLELIVNTTDNTLGDLGVKLPNLSQLKLNNSTIPSIRDLGTTLMNVTVLWLNRCSLMEVEGIAALPNLKELYLAFNEIEDISALSALEKLESLDLESNSISDIEQIQHLIECQQLYSLTLDGNPISNNSSYRSDVLAVLTSIAYLDDIPAQRLERKKSRAKEIKEDLAVDVVEDNPFDMKQFLSDMKLDLKFLEERGMLNDLPAPDTSRPMTAKQKTSREVNMLQQSIKYANVTEDLEGGVTQEPVIVAMTARGSRPASAASFRRPGSATGRPSSARNRPSTAMSFVAQNQMTRFSRPQSARPQTARLSRPSSALLTQRSNSRLGSSTEDPFEDSRDSSSALTYGSNQIFCGNPVKALRKRKQENIENNCPSPVMTLGDDDILGHVINTKLKEIDEFADLEQEDDDIQKIDDSIEEIEFNEEDLLNKDCKFTSLTLNDIPELDEVFPTARKSKKEKPLQKSSSKSKLNSLRTSSSSDLTTSGRQSSASPQRDNSMPGKLRPVSKKIQQQVNSTSLGDLEDVKFRNSRAFIPPLNREDEKM